MPVMDGLEATRRIRALEAEEGRAPCLVFAVTAHATAEDREVRLGREREQGDQNGGLPCVACLRERHERGCCGKAWVAGLTVPP